MYRISQSQKYFKPVTFSFHQLLVLTRQFGCKDHRDKIFGILGIPTTNQAPFIQADYNKSLAEVYREVACKVIDRSSSLALLSSVQREWWKSSRNAPDPDIPSWIPQWHVAIAPTLTPMEPDGNFMPDAGRALQRKGHSDAGRLIIRGIDIEAVSGIAYGWSDFVRGKQSIHGFFGFSGPSCPVCGESRALPIGGSAAQLSVDELPKRANCTQANLEALAITLTAGKDWYGLPLQDRRAHLADFTKCLLKDGLRWSLHSDAFGTSPGKDSTIDGLTSTICYNCERSLQSLAERGNTDRFLDAAATAGEQRKRLVTTSGMRGIGPGAMEVGDRVCVLYGANMPFLLRPQEDAYFLIGECYIHDLMHGEAVQQLLERRSGLEEKWIELR
jgi:hypothetical protein